MGTQMEAVVLAWLVLTRTDNPFLVGGIAAARMALNILALVAGAVADRMPRNRLLAAVEFLMTLFGVAMLILIFSDRLETWHIFAIAVTAGMVRVFQMPAGQSLVADTLPEDRINNGAAFNTLGRNIAMLIGPLVGGLLFKHFEVQGAYIAIASLYFLSGLFALNIRSSGSVARREPKLNSIARYWERAITPCSLLTTVMSPPPPPPPPLPFPLPLPPPPVLR